MRVGETEVGKIGVGEKGVGETGVGETGIPRFNHRTNGNVNAHLISEQIISTSPGYK